ncbi:MAG TPA: pyridoxamine 5'-phosphate oxidase family protein [Thermoleophilia bacterium]|nr:pyridoxamine 5'-phosphate oxidase family protein [Thermoleophilia bacterium]
MTTNRRLLSEQEQINLENILHQAPIGFLAVLADGPYVVPINFVHDSSDEPNGWGRILFHSGEGKKSVALAADPRVCMAVVTETAFDRGATPCDDGFTYRSTLVKGKASLLTDRAEREVALRMIVAKYDPEAARDDLNEQIFEQTLVYSVAIESVSFKQRPRRSTSPPAV